MQGFKARRLKIIEKGLDNYTGLFGDVDFVDGVSSDLVGWQEAHRLGANVQIVDADNLDYQIGPVAEYERNLNTPADAHVVKAVDGGVIQPNGEIKLAVQRFSPEELENLASEKGLHGIRELARAHGKTGRSIQDCIEVILEAQGDTPIREE